MKTQLRIIIIFSILFVTSFVTEILPKETLGDWKCQGQQVKEVKGHYSDGSVLYTQNMVGCSYFFSYDNHESTVHYGFRHYLFFILGLVLFIYNIYKLANLTGK